MIGAFLLCAPALVQGETPSLARVSSIPMSTGFRVTEALTLDVDGDGVADLVVSSSGPDNVRRLAIHVRRKSGPAFVSAADAALDVTPDVVCFAAADVHPDAGREIVLFTAKGAFAWRWRSTAEAERFQRLFACDLLWQWPDTKKVHPWQAAVVDLDGDGLEDFAVPEPGQYALALQRNDKDGARTFTALQRVSPGGGRDLVGQVERSAEVRQPGGKRRANVSITGNGVQVDSGRLGPAPYLWVRESVPAGQVEDFDGDGDKDVLFLGTSTLEVYVQEPRGTFATAPLVLQNPVPVDRQRALDISFTAKSFDFDGDKRVDCLISAGDKRSDTVRTQMQVFLAKAVKAGEPALFGAEGRPTQLLVLDGFSRPLAYDDVDGDGLADLVAGSVRPDLIDGLRAAASERIEAELYVYRNTGTGFSKRPDLVYKLSVQATGLDLVARFAGDVTGDGIADFFEHADKNALRVRMVRKTRDGLTILDKPVYEMALADDARVLMPGRIGPGTWDLFVIEKEAVRCASFR